MEQTESEQITKSSKGSFIAMGLVIVALIGGFVYFTQSSKTSSGEMTESSESSMMEEVMPEASSSDSMMEKTESADAMSAEHVVEVTMEGGAFYFKPDRIEAKKGDTVKVTLTSVDMPHNFFIDEFKVRSATVTKGNSTTFEFTPDKTGEFEFYCAVGNHRAQGMVGTLVVTE